MTQLGKCRSAINRFYNQVSVVAADSHAFEAGLGYEIHLDGRPAKTPARSPLATNNDELAEAIAEEWRAQGERIDTQTMPLTRLLTTSLDLGPVQRESWIEDILAYLDSDLLCYRAEGPEELKQRQESLWTPFIAALKADSVSPISLVKAEGVSHVAQPPENCVNARRLLDKFSNEALIAVKTITEITGSAALALICRNREVDPDEIFRASRVDEDFQAEQWGLDAEAEARAKEMKREFDAAFRFLKFF